MTDRSERRPSASQLHPLAMREIRVVMVAACAVALLGTIVGGHIYGRFLAARDVGGRDNAIEQLQAQTQKLKRALDDMSAQNSQLADKLKNAQAALEAVVPAKDTFNLSPNESRIIADGRLTVGLVGAPANQGIMLNINGKQQTVAAGQVTTVGADGSDRCQVTVQSFDMFGAMINASCSDAKAQ